MFCAKEQRKTLMHNNVVVILNRSRHWSTIQEHHQEVIKLRKKIVQKYNYYKFKIWY